MEAGAEVAAVAVAVAPPGAVTALRELDMLCSDQCYPLQARGRASVCAQTLASLPAGCRAPFKAMLKGCLKLTLTTTCLVHSLSSEGAEAGGSTAGLARSVAVSRIDPSTGQGGAPASAGIHQ